MGEPDFIGERGDELVAAGGEVGGDARDCGREAGEEQHPAAGDGDGLLGGQSLRQAARGAQDDRGIATQEDAEAFLLHRRMEAADDAAAFVAPTGGLVVGAEDGVAGAAGGAEERGLGQGEQFKVAEGVEFSRGGRAQTRGNPKRPACIARRQAD